MKQKNDFGIHIGTASILLIFIVLALVSFAALTLSSAVADQKLTDKAESKTRAYYAACDEAWEALSSLDATLKKGYEDGLSESDYFATYGTTASYQYEISSSQVLSVEVNILYPESDGGPYYEITAWQEVLTESEEDYDSSLHLLLE